VEKEIINSLDNLSIEQTERLLDKNMKTNISGKNLNRIKNSVFEKSGFKKQRRLYIPKKSAACVAAFAIIFISLSLAGFDDVAAAIRSLFTFIPGVGIEVKTDAAIYAIEPIVAQTKSGNAKANIVSAVYADGYLNVTVEVVGKELYHDGFAFDINGEQLNYQDEQFNNGYTLSASANGAMLNFSYKTKTPEKDDVYKISVSGFSEHLSFKMIPCLDYDDIKQIGPTDIQNGISITAAAQKFDGQLTVWCYPFKTAGAAKDFILGYGEPGNAAFNTLRYIKTENRQIFNTVGGWQLKNRFVFDMTESEQSAILHIPYLSMLREEKKKLNINLPKDYNTVKSDAAVECSLGIIKAVEVKRMPNEHENDKDTVMIKFSFDSKDSNMVFNSFNFEIAEKYLSNAKHFDAETGKLEYLEIYVDKNDNKISLNLTDLYYYLLGEYVIPLDIQ